MMWWQRMILERYETHGLMDKQPAAEQCLKEIEQGRWQVFAYELENVVFIVGPSNHVGVGHVHVWAHEGNLLRAGHKFMAEVWAHSDYISLVAIVMDSRVERFAQHLRWSLVDTHSLIGERYWIAWRRAT
jgi:hypothetical protein